MKWWGGKPGDKGWKEQCQRRWARFQAQDRCSASGRPHTLGLTEVGRCGPRAGLDGPGPLCGRRSRDRQPPASCWWTQVESGYADNVILTHCESQRPSKFVSDYPMCGHSHYFHSAWARVVVFGAGPSGHWRYIGPQRGNIEKMKEGEVTEQPLRAERILGTRGTKQHRRWGSLQPENKNHTNAQRPSHGEVTT